MSPANTHGSFRWSYLLALLLSLTLALLVLAPGPQPAAGDEDANAPEPAASWTPIFAKTEPAGDAQRLVLLADQRKVVGWISGAKDHAGRQVTVACTGRTDTVLVQDGNTFTWHYQADKPVEAKFTLGDQTRTLTLQPPAKLPPSVFFVVDRTVYRPGQSLHFAAFLRRMDELGRFVPVANQTAAVELRSQQKNTLAARFDLTSDALGRITASYAFSDADALDNYTLTVAGYQGSATVTHAEYRKSKIKLKIAGKVEDDKLKLTFAAVDFLDKPVAGSKVSITAQVVRNAPKKAQGLDPTQFAYAEAVAFGLPALEDMTVEQRLVAEAGGAALPMLGYSGPTVLAQTTEDLPMDASGVVEHALEVKKEWLSGDCTVMVQGILVDANGREQRASESVALQRAGQGLQIVLPKRYYQTDEEIRLTAKVTDASGKALTGASSLVAMRLSASMTASYGYYGGMFPGNQIFDMQDQGVGAWNNVAFGAAPYYSSSARYRRWYPQPMPAAFERTMITAVPLKDGAAAFRLPEPGAYKLVVVTTLPDGQTVQDEVGCVVREPEQMPVVVLRLDRELYHTGQMLKGQIDSRCADAVVLLTLRDSAGVRWWKPVKLDGGVARFEQRLPGDLRYGVSVDAQLVDKEGRAHAGSQLVHVVPDDRILTIATKMKEVVQPGETVKIDLEVNRQEPVDLVVSVYDQSLLGIAPDKSVDPRNFYLADDRVREQATRDVLARRLGDLTVGELMDKAKALLAEKPKLAETPAGQPLRDLVSRYNSRQFYAYDLVALLGFAGIRAQPVAMHWGWMCRLNDKDPARTRLIDLFDQANGEWRLGLRFAHDTLVVAETNPNLARSYLNGYAMPQYYAYDARYRARGDAHLSGVMMVSGNASMSFMPEAQGFISHMPGPGMATAELIGLDPGAGVATPIRTDFSDSAFWKADVRTDKSGKASVQVKLPDSLTNWQVVVTAISQDMHVGRHKARVQTFKPIMVWPMLPRVFTSGDKIDIFASVHNRTDQEQKIDVAIKVQNGRLLSEPKRTILVPPKSNAPVYWTFEAGEAGYTQILMSATCPAGDDASLKRLPVSRAAAEQAVTLSGSCQGASVFTVPADADLKSSSLDITFAPSLAADLADTLNYLVEYPHGCVEQTMSRFLPAIKVAQVLQRYQIEHKELKERLPKCVAGGIKRLFELQQPDGGWGWNGSSTTHEMMTPYALYGLMEAEKAGYSLGNSEKVEQGLGRLENFIQNMNEAQAADRIYCMYVYSHRREIKPEWWKFVEDQRAKNRLSDYALGLALEMAATKNQKDLAGKLAAALSGRAQRQGGTIHWTTAGFSRWGDNPLEVTAAVMKALVAYDAEDKMIPGVLAYFAANKNGDRWNSTKDTAMIIFAMCDYLAKRDVSPSARNVVAFSVNGSQPQQVTFDGGLSKRVTFTGEQLRRGQNTLAFANDSPGALYRVMFRYWKEGKEVGPMDAGIKVERRFYLVDDKGNQSREVKPGDSVPRGAYVLSQVTARRAAVNEMRYVLVSNPKPAGSEILPVDDPRFQRLGSTAFVLREDKTAGVLWHHEQTGQQIHDQCVVHCEMSGEYLVPPAAVELMYQTDQRGHSGVFYFRVTDQDDRTRTAAR